MNFPSELWTLIKEYQIEQKKHHNIKYKYVIRAINYSFGPRITVKNLYFPPPKFYEIYCKIPLRINWGEPKYKYISGENRFVDLKLELTTIIHHREKCSNWASRFPPFHVTVGYGWQNWKGKPPNKF